MEWTKEQERYLKENWCCKSREELKIYFNKTLYQIYNKAKELNLNIDEKLSHNARIRNWTKEEIKSLIDLASCGVKYDEISRILNRSLSAISIKLNILGISRNNKWTDEEIELLKSKYETSTTEQLIRLFPTHTLGSINKKAVRFGLIRKNVKKPIWTEKEIGYLKQLVKTKHTDEEISKILDRPVFYVKSIRRKYCREYFIWSDKEIKIIKDKYKTTLMKDLLLLLPHKTKDQIQKQANRLNLYKPPSLLWDEEEINILKREYPHKTIEELKIIFPDKSKNQIKKKAKRLRLKKTEETLARCFNMEIGKVPKMPSRKAIWRQKILKRDRFCCQECNLEDKTGLKLQAHHIIPKRDPDCDLYDINNGICLCINCHEKIHNKEYKMIEKYKEIVRRH